MLQAELMVLAFKAVTFGRLIDAGLATALPGALGHFDFGFMCGVPPGDADAVKNLGFQVHQS